MRFRKWRWPFLGGIGFLILLCTFVWFRGKGSRGGESPSPGSEEPRRTQTTPYRNVRPEVAYVGDAVCADCHPAETIAYRRHPMGRSLAPVSRAAFLSPSDRSSHNSFEAAGARYQVSLHDGRLQHEEVRHDLQGRTLARTTEEVSFVIGSGTRTFSYLIDHEGFLFQSPITWFSQKKIWDLSPGFEARAERFGRPVTAECLFCHCNRVEPVEHTLNRFREPPFDGYAIGCERCHGPGQLHVQAREAGEPADGLDDTIVNPRRLEPSLREAVCQQCHLEGEIRVLRHGREPFDYRPGLPLKPFFTVFVKPHEPTDRLVGSFEQLYASRCFRASEGKLGCIFCHNPHGWPAAEDKVGYYRDRCLQCHQAVVSGEIPNLKSQIPNPTGLGFEIWDLRFTTHHSPKDNCIACHMPRINSSDIPHVAVTDHRIPRRIGETPRMLGDLAGLPRAGGMPLVVFPQEPVDPEDAETARDLGVAMTTLATRAPDPAKRLCLVTLPYLERAVKAWPDDLPAAEALAYALSLDGKNREALDVCEATLTRVPDREATLELAARLAGHLGDRKAALAYWRRAVGLSPWSSRYRVELARLLAEQEQWPEVLDACQTVLRRNPANVRARLLLAAAYARNGDPAQARAELERAAGLDPGRRDDLWRWLGSRVR